MSERTADADVAIVEKLLRIGNQDDKLLSGRAYRPWTWDEGHAALDRLVARNQQLQEALERIRDTASGYLNHPFGASDLDLGRYNEIRLLSDRALASVRARTP